MLADPRGMPNGAMGFTTLVSNTHCGAAGVLEGPLASYLPRAPPQRAPNGESEPRGNACGDWGAGGMFNATALEGVWR